MTNTRLLEEIIESSGLKKKTIAERANLSLQGLMNKIKGVREFKVGEVLALCDLLSLDAETRELVFFAPNSELNSRKDV